MGRAVTHAVDLLVAGRPSVDVLFSGLETWPALGHDIETRGFGWCAGTSFNTPAAANRLGLRVAYVATIGNDVWSGMIREEFAAEALPTDHLEVQPRPLPAVSVAMNLDGDRGFVTHWAGDEDLDRALAARALEVAGTIDAAHLHAYADDAPALESIARDRGMTVSLDGSGGSSWTSDRPLDEILARADVLFANGSEACAMTGEDGVEAALGRLAEHCPCVVVKRGALGAIGLADGVRSVVPADPVEVVDTTGAGDAFNAGFLVGWLRGADLETALTLGVLCGTGAVTDVGGYRGCPDAGRLRTLAAARGVTMPEPGGGP
jgi:sugar/nucleoside kinase (ribokinase family)